MVVVLPAPFGPMNPKTSPSGIERFRPSSASVCLKVRVRFSVTIMSVMGGVPS
jgi:hypothetical protein